MRSSNRLLPRRKGKPLNNTSRRDEPDLVSAKEVALGLSKRAWRTVKWLEGVHNDPRFAG